jgi:hypothetical protein
MQEEIDFLIGGMMRGISFVVGAQSVITDEFDWRTPIDVLGIVHQEVEQFSINWYVTYAATIKPKMGLLTGG